MFDKPLNIPFDKVLIAYNKNKEPIFQGKVLQQHTTYALLATPRPSFTLCIFPSDGVCLVANPYHSHPRTC